MLLLAVGRAAVAQDLLTVSGAVTTRADSIQTFPRQSPFGMNGRAIYARIGGKF